MYNLLSLFPSLTDFYLEDLPDDLLVNSIDLPSLDGPATADLANMTGLNSQPQTMPGLSATPPTSSQAQIMQSSVSMMPQQQQQTTQQLPAASSAVQPTQPHPPPSSTPVPLSNSNPQRATGLTTSAGAPPNTTVVSTTADPTPALPNISSTSATAYPANVANPLPSATLGMTMPPRGPPASNSYNSYVGGMTSSAPAINSQMNPMQPQQTQQMVNYISSGSLRHPSATPSMGHMHGQMVHPHAQQRNMIAGQPGMIQMRQRQPMMHPMHGASSMMAGHPQAPMGMQHHSHMIAHGGQQVGMSGGMMQHNHGAMHMPPNMHLSPYDPRSRMMQPAIMTKPGMSIHHHRMQNPHQMQHPAMHPGRIAPRPHVPGNHMQYVGDPSGYQGNMRGGYQVAPGQSGLSPHSQAGSSQMLNQQLPVANTVPPNPQNMPTQQQPPRPPSEGVAQGSPLPGQLSSTAGAQLQVATPPHQQQATHPHQQATPSQPHPQGAAALNVSL